MSEFLPFIVTGIATGAIYGLAGVGLVLTYKTSGIFNFGYGAVATVAAYVFYWMTTDLGLGWVPAAAIAVLVLGPLMGLAFERMAVLLAPQPTTMKVVGTVGVILVVQGLATIAYGTKTIRVDAFLPGSSTEFELFGVVLTWDMVIVTAVGALAVAALYALFRYARLGIAMRAVVDEPSLLAMQGTNPDRVRRAAWIIGTTFASLCGVLMLPLVGLNSILLTLLVVQAFGAAAVGAFSSIPLTFAGGLLIGILADVSKRYVIDVSWLSGVPAALPFIVLFVALLVVPKRKLVPPSLLERRAPLRYRAPGGVRIAGTVLLLIPLLLVPQFAGSRLIFFTTALCTAIMLLALGLLVRTSGQVSLCHAAFGAIGAVAFSQLSIGAGLPWILALLLGAAVAIPAGVLVAIPAIRLSGLFLALATLGFGVLVERLLYTQPFMFTTLAQGVEMPRPSFAESQEGFYYLVLAALVISALLLVVVQRSRLGRMLRGMSGSQTAMTSMGLSINTTKVIVFCISAYMAGIAGALFGMSQNYASANDPFFVSFQSMLLLALVVLVPLAEPWYALAAIGMVVPAFLTGGDTTYWLNVLFGVSAIAVAVAGAPAMPAGLKAWLEHFRRHRPEPPGEELERSQPPPRRASVGKEGIAVRDLRVRFGGLLAVDGISLDAPLGQITALIGPNGAGKTTTFDACSGLNRRYEGTVALHGEDVSRTLPAARARQGLGRTFQRTQLVDELTVAENVALGHEAGLAGWRPDTQLASSPLRLRETRAATASALDLCEIEDLAGEQAGALSTGQRRLVELARAVAGPFDLLLLDEPSSGLDTAETARCAALFRRLVEERGTGILLVEHDVDLVMSISEQVYVLDFGEMIFAGPPAAVAASDVVRAAYLGDEFGSGEREGSVG